MAVNPVAAIRNAWRAMRAPAAASAQAALQSQPADPQRGTMLQVLTRNYADVRVTPDVALMVSAVWACIDVIAGAMSASNWDVYGGARDNGNEYLLPGDATHYLLNTRWNPEMTAQAAKRALFIGAVGMGNGYAEIERDLAGRVAAVWPIRTDRVEPMRDMDTGRLFYRVHNDLRAGWVDLDPRDVLHIRGPGVDGLLGDNAMARAVQTIAKAIAIDQFSAAYFGNSTQLGGVLTATGKVDDNTYDRLKKQFEERHRGSANAFRTAILEGGMSWQAVTTDAEKAQLIQAAQNSVEEIARWFHVPPHKIGHLARSTNNNIEHQGLEFVRDTLRPWRVETEQECDYKLFPARGVRRFVCVDLDWATDGDFKSRMEAFQIARGMGVFSANDILRKLGENTIGPEGDLRIVNGAAIPLKDVGKNYAVAAPAPAATPGDDGEDPADAEDPAAGDTSTIEAWTRSVLARVAARRDSRAADLRRGGRPADEAMAQAQADTVRALPAMAADLLDMLDACWPGSAARAQFFSAARAVIAGGAPADAAAEFIRTVRAP
jgi:HK97 family phage portal protein